MDTEISPTSSQHDQSLEPMNPSNGSLPGNVDESNKRRKTITDQKEKLVTRSREEIEDRKNLRKRLAKFYSNIDISSDDEEDLFPGMVVTNYDSDGDDMLEMENGVRHMNSSELAWLYHPNEERKGEKFELLEVITVNRQSCGDFFYYYTLKLKNETGCEKEYRVKVRQNCETNKINLLLLEEVSSEEAIEPMTMVSGGKGTLGKLLDTCCEANLDHNDPCCDTCCEANLDHNDPNYNNDKVPPQLVWRLPPLATITDSPDDCKRAVVSIIEEYFTNYSVEAASSDLRVQEFCEFHPYFIKRLVSMPMDRHDKEKEMASFLLWALMISQLLLESADDLSVDIPDAVMLLAHFVVRGVFDEILPSAFITRSQKLLSPSSKGYQALQVAEGTYLSAAYCVMPREWAWDRASLHTMEELKLKIADILKEYVDIGDSGKVYRFVRELVVSFFHHKVVMQGTILAMVTRSYQPLIMKLLKEAAEEELISSSQMVKGLDCLCLHAPSASSDFPALVSLAIFEGWLDESFHDLVDGSCGMGGTD